MEDSRAFADESLNQLYGAIRQLSEVDRAVILLYLDEKSSREIGEIIGANPNNVGVRINRIKDRLRRHSMRKTIEATWREGFLNPDALVAPKINDLYTRKSRHIVDRIQRMLRINEIAIVIGAPIGWALLSAVGIPYTGAIICTVCIGLLVVRRLYITKFAAPANSLDSYHYLKAFHGWLKDRMARSKRVQRHLYAVTFLALAIGVGHRRVPSC